MHRASCGVRRAHARAWSCVVTRLPRLPRAPLSPGRPGGPAAPLSPRSPRAPAAPSHNTTHRHLSSHSPIQALLYNSTTALRLTADLNYVHYRLYFYFLQADCTYMSQAN
ncbi:unnamed protein product [Chrysodeixis includens]|uniref:Uncharacterized protein n=1 Tax=Chrysodeixis includens TaxID=689277 RepID=A0A9N8KT00_CHRIL|nr:unnamed protein product [Chrysodeixis includens]